ncbi:hypothetical protein V6380_04310, partial [Acinetobacter variabilis]
CCLSLYIFMATFIGLIMNSKCQQTLIGLGAMLVSGSVFATIEQTIVKLSLGELKGRYALDCSKEKAHNLSYVIGEKSILRLISAKQKRALLKSIEPKSEKSFDDYQYITTAEYQGATVDFYQKDHQNYARVLNTSLSNSLGPKNKQMLIQCKTEAKS